jgi:hypothetical protein
MNSTRIEISVPTGKKGITRVVSFSVWKLGEMPEEHQTAENYLKALKKVRKDHFDLFATFPDKFKTKEICKYAVKKDGMCIKYVPEALKTLDLWCAAAATSVGSSPFTLDDAPAEWHEKIWIARLLAVFAIEDEIGRKVLLRTLLEDEMPKELRDHVFTEAIRQNPQYLEYIPDSPLKERVKAALGIK